MPRLPPSGLALPGQLAVIYRNRGKSTVTIDVGAFIDPLTLTDENELQNDRMPAGPEVSAFAKPGVETD